MLQRFHWGGRGYFDIKQVHSGWSALQNPVRRAKSFQGQPNTDDVQTDKHFLQVLELQQNCNQEGGIRNKIEIQSFLNWLVAMSLHKRTFIDTEICIMRAVSDGVLIPSVVMWIQKKLGPLPTRQSRITMLLKCTVDGSHYGPKAILNLHVLCV